MSDSGLLYNDLSTKGIAKLNSYRAIANSTSHDITLFGDLQINPGRVIELLFPKALDPEELKENLIAQLTEPVRWTQTIQKMIKDGASTFTEVGPGNVLQGLVRKIDRSVKTYSGNPTF